MLSPGDADTRANLELARSLTVDAVEPLPTFWAITAARWWVDALPRPVLLTVVEPRQPPCWSNVNGQWSIANGYNVKC